MEQAIQRVGVVGCGLMGSGIAEVAAKSGYTVVVREANEDYLQSGLKRIEGSLERAVVRGKLASDDRDQARKRIVGTTDMAAFAQCDLVIEAVTEDLPLKKKIFAELDGVAPPHAILASNTSADQASTERRVTVLLMGVDNRPDERIEATRTDSIIVLTVNPSTGAAGMLSVARDMLIYVPALKHDAKVNTVHVLGYVNKYPGGGPAMLKDTMAEFLGYPIDYYVRLNFDGFRQVIDLIGGIDVDVPADIHDPLYPDNNYGYEGFDITAGRHHLDGTTALKYARTRHGDSDYDRARRQQQVIMAVRDKLSKPGQLAALIPRIPGLAIALANSIQTDMPVDRAISLARSLDSSDLRSPARVVVDNSMGTQDPNDPNFGFILKPDLNKVHAAAAAIFADQAQGPSPEEALRKSLKSEEARVVVLNGSSQEGLAAKTAAALNGEGYNVIAVGNAEAGDGAQTYLITYGDTKPATREALLLRFNLTPDRIRNEPPSTDADLAIVLGNDATLGASASAGGPKQ